MAATTGELEPLGLPDSPVIASSEELTARVDDWRRYRQGTIAGDLISAGLVLSATDNRDVRDAAKYILSLGPRAPASVRRLASAVEEQSFDHANDPAHEPDVAEILPEESHSQIRSIKARLIDYPRNALLWVDMARHYAMLGATNQALRSMRAGIALAKDSRFVLRSAARLYVHIGDAEQAYDLLRKSPATRRDPWLRAAEIAVAGLADKTPAQLRNTKRGLLATKYAPRYISELASAVATFELTEGSAKSARRLFNLGLQQPTENTVAQADWATNHISGISLKEDHFLVPRTFEAKASLHLEKMELPDCLLECSRWLEDEPFSSRPVEIGSFLSIAAFEDYDTAIELSKRGLVSNQDHFILLNNLSVALAESGRIDEAKRTHQTIKVSNRSEWEKTCWLATKGLFAFREGRYIEGRQFYEQARASARVQGRKDVEAMVLIHWAREESKAGQHPESEAIAGQAVQASRGFSSIDVKIALSRLNRLLHIGDAGNPNQVPLL